MKPKPKMQPARRPLFMVEVRAGDWARSLAWYEQVLGWPLVLSDPANGFALLGDRTGRLAIKQARGPGLERGESGISLVVQVDDLDVERARLGALGVAVSEDRENAREGYREFSLADPDGTVLRFFAWAGRGPA